MSTEAELEASIADAEGKLSGLQSQLSLLESGTTGASMLADLKALRVTVAADTEAALKLSAERDALNAECEKMQANNSKLENQITHLKRALAEKAV